jgi:hypothetical protein
VEKYVVGRLAEGWPAMSTVDRRRHDNRIGVTLDGFIDNCRPDGASLQQLSDDAGVSGRKRTPSRVLGVTQGSLSRVNLGG